MMKKAAVPMLVVSGAMLAVSPWLINAVRYESTMGLVQKIFYFHFPSAFLYLIAAITCGVHSALFLWRQQRRNDAWAIAAAEMVLVFGAITLVTGPLWARKAWGVWWVWDVRLTSSLLVWMTFGAYLMLRRFGGPGSDKLGAGMALFGMFNVPFIYVSVNIWRTLHPPSSVVPTLPVDMGAMVWYCFAAFFLLFLALMSLRAELAMQEARLEDLFLAEDES
jgi:heme exporter protein C